MNLVSKFIEQVATRPEQRALIQTINGRELVATYRELDLSSARAAGWLHSLGLRKGDRALIYEAMSIELYTVLIGLWRIGAIAVFIDPSGGKRLLEASCRLAKPSALIATGTAHLYRLISSEMRRVPVKVSIGRCLLPSRSWAVAASGDPWSGAEPVDNEHPALYTFTSGSTGAPKGVSRTHGLLLAQLEALKSGIELEAGETDLATLPVFALANLASGLTTLIPDCDLRRPGFIDGDKVVRQLKKYRPERCVASPAFFSRLCDSCAASGERLPFKKLFTGGAPVFPRNLQRISQFAPEARVTVVYGSTEAEPVSHVGFDVIAPEDFEAMRQGRGLLVGPPVSETRLRIIEDRCGEALPRLTEAEFDELTLKDGLVGEIVVSGDHVLPGYLQGVGDAENKIHVGDAVWHRTGDAGYVDEQGRLWLLGRCSSKVAGGEGAIYPFSVETAASLDERVAWSALVEREGRRVLVVEPARGGDAFPLESLRIPQGMVDELQFVPVMPLDKRHNAKIDYRALEKLLRGRSGRAAQRR